LRLRRQSVDLGLTLQDGAAPSAQKMSTLGLSDLTTSQIARIADNLILSIKGSNGVQRAIDTWATAELPEATSDEAKEVVLFMKRVLLALASKIVKWLKMVRIGLTVRIAVALLLTYEDFLTDVLVTMEYKNTNREDYFLISIYIVAIAISFHCLVSILNSTKKPFKTRVRRFFFSLFMLTPIVDAYNIWVGKEHDFEEQFTPEESLVMSRVIELVFESLPESVLQSYIMLNSKPDEISGIMVFSIFASLAAAAFIMADSTVSYERNGMDSYLGPYVHPVWGFIPSSTKDQVGLYLGMFSFLFGYLGMNIMCLTTLTMHAPSALTIPTIYFVEFFMFLLIQYRRGQFYYFGAPVGKDKDTFAKSVSAIVNTGYFLLCSFLPWGTMRHPSVLGGKFFGAWIMYTIVKSSSISLFGLLVLAEGDQKVASIAFGSSLVLCFLGIVFTLYFSHGPHSHTWYTNRFETRCWDSNLKFSDEQVSHRTHDEAAANALIKLHSSYHEKQNLTSWVTSIDFDTSPIFLQSTSLPHTITGKSEDVPHSFLFKRLRLIAEWFEDNELTELVDTTVTELEMKLEARIKAEEAETVERQISKAHSALRQR